MWDGWEGVGGVRGRGARHRCGSGPTPPDKHLESARMWGTRLGPVPCEPITNLLFGKQFIDHTAHTAQLGTERPTLTYLPVVRSCVSRRVRARL